MKVLGSSWFSHHFSDSDLLNIVARRLEINKYLMNTSTPTVWVMVRVVIPFMQCGEKTEESQVLDEQSAG